LNAVKLLRYFISQSAQLVALRLQHFALYASPPYESDQPFELAILQQVVFADPLKSQSQYSEPIVQHFCRYAEPPFAQLPAFAASQQVVFASPLYTQHFEFAVFE
jgi:hypothetical protein